MSLIDEITSLRDDSLSSLDASHNYYAHTKNAWRIVQQLIRRGHQISIQNLETGNTVDETEIPEMAQKYVRGYLVSAAFQHFVSLFERFLSDFLSVWLTEYPESLSKHELKFRTVLDATDKDEIVAAVVQKELLGLGYQGVSNWFEYLEKITQLGCPSEDQIKKFAEIKASRDVLVHNNGIANSIYVKKSMGRARFADGEELEIPEQYHRESWQLIKQVVAEVANAGINKLRN